MSEYVKQWIPDDPEFVDGVNGDFFMVTHPQWKDGGSKIIYEFLHALANAKIIRGVAFMGKGCIYIDAHLPTQKT